MLQFLKIILGMKPYMFRTVPLSIIRSFSLYTQQWYMSYRFADSLRAGAKCSILILLASCPQNCMTYTIAVCTVKNSWWWTEELSETCRVSFQEWIWEIGASSLCYYKKFNTMRGHMNARFVHSTLHASTPVRDTFKGTYKNYSRNNKCTPLEGEQGSTKLTV